MTKSDMKRLLHHTLMMMFAVGLFTLASCNDDGMDDDEMEMGPDETGEMVTYNLDAVGENSASGMATFAKLDDGSIKITLEVEGAGDGMHPAHIHRNTAAESGDIAISLTPVEEGASETIITATDGGNAISYEELINFDGYINVHQSAEDLATLIVQGDIGQNALTGESKAYTLSSVSNPDISGTATFYQRENDETLAVLNLMNTPDGGMHPAHIHMNTAAEGGDIAITFTPVDGSSGMSKTNIAMTDAGEAITYEEILNFDGYVNVHASADDLATLVAQGDIGQNELTGESMEYDLGSVSDPEISGVATFYQRANDETLAILDLMNTPEGSMHPAHIHMNTAAEGGDIAITFTPVDGSSGMSKTNIAMTDAGEAITYEEVLNYDGYVNVHASADDLATLVAQGDIGQNELTGESVSYTLSEVDIPGISGTAMFHERVNGETLVVMNLTGPVTDNHPSHIHSGSVADAPGDILITLTSVNDEGISKTNISINNAGNAIDYTGMTSIDGYINVHASPDDLATLAAQGNVGANAE